MRKPVGNVKTIASYSAYFYKIITIVTTAHFSLIILSLVYTQMVWIKFEFPTCRKSCTIGQNFLHIQSFIYMKYCSILF